MKPGIIEVTLLCLVCFSSSALAYQRGDIVSVPSRLDSTKKINVVVDYNEKFVPVYEKAHTGWIAKYHPNLRLDQQFIAYLDPDTKERVPVPVEQVGPMSMQKIAEISSGLDLTKIRDVYGATILTSHGPKVKFFEPYKEGEVPKEMKMIDFYSSPLQGECLHLTNSSPEVIEWTKKIKTIFDGYFPELGSVQARPQIKFYGQMHWRPEINKRTPQERQELIGLISKSQWDIFSYLKHNPNVDLFAEGETQTLTPEIVDSVYENVAGLFPLDKSEPQNYDDLSSEQKELLARMGAPSLALHYGLIKKVYPTTNRKKEGKLHSKIASLGIEKPSARPYLFDRREFLALESISDHLKARPSTESNPILLVYGKSHRFGERHFKNNRNSGVSFEEIKSRH